MALQAAAYLILGTTRAAMGMSEFILVLHNLLAIVCAWIAWRRARGIAALFWLLFIATLLLLLLPSTILAISTIFDRTLLSPATWRVLYCLYGTPLLMMLFLPSSDRDGRFQSEIYLDLFQVTIVTCLGFYAFFYMPLRQMLLADALLRNLDLSNLESVFLLLAIFIRLRFVHRQVRRLLLHIGLFTLLCALVTFIGNWIDAHYLSSLSAWWDLGWALPYAAAALVAPTWEPGDSVIARSEPVHFGTFLSNNLMLAALLVGIHALTDHWQETTGVTITNLVIAASLLAFTIRLATTQFNQHREITQRKQPQDELSAANATISSLLDDARADANAIAQVSQLSSLLQPCSSRDEAFRLLPQWLARVFPGTSGFLSVLNPSRNHAECAATWGTAPSPQSPAADCDRKPGPWDYRPSPSPLSPTENLWACSPSRIINKTRSWNHPPPRNSAGKPSLPIPLLSTSR